MQEIADRYPSSTEYPFPFTTSDNKLKASRDVKWVRENMVNAKIGGRVSRSTTPSRRIMN